MTYKKTDMLYNDGKYYKWTAKADHDNPMFIHGKDHEEMDKTEGYEVLRFINQFAKSVSWSGSGPGLSEFQKIEKMIRYDIPGDIRKHADKKNR